MFGNRSFGGVVATINRTWANKQLLACTRLRIVRWIIRTVQSVLPQPDLPPNSKGDLSVIFVSVNGHRSSFLLPLPIKNQSWTPTLRSTRGLVYDAVNRLAVEYNHCSQPTSVLLCSVVFRCGNGGEDVGASKTGRSVGTRGCADRGQAPHTVTQPHS